MSLICTGILRTTICRTSSNPLQPAQLNFLSKELFAGIRLINAAEGKGASLSSQSHFKGPPSKAVDGNINPHWYFHSCTQTDNEFEPWFMVELGAEFKVYKVIVTNRKDCCGMYYCTSTRILEIDLNQQE